MNEYLEPLVAESVNTVYKTKEQIEEMIKKLENKKNIYYNEEQAIKLIINSMYGAIANIYFAAFNLKVAEAITMQGQDLIKFAEEILNDYFMNQWHLDKELHKKLGVDNVSKLSTPVVIYIDTDSVQGDSIVKIKVDDSNTGIYVNHEIGRLFDIIKDSEYQKDYTEDERGNQVITPNHLLTKVADDNGVLIDARINKLIRHKVSKRRFKITTANQKTVIVTEDHSVIVWRDGKRISVKPMEINLKTDKVLCVQS